MLFAKRASDEHGNDNKGLYGVDTDYVVPYTIPSTRFIESGLSGFLPDFYEPKGETTHGAAPETFPNPTDLKVPQVWRTRDSMGEPLPSRLVRLRKNMQVTQNGSFTERFAVGGGSTLPGYHFVGFGPAPFPNDTPF